METLPAEKPIVSDALRLKRLRTVITPTGRALLIVSVATGIAATFFPAARVPFAYLLAVWLVAMSGLLLRRPWIASVRLEGPWETQAGERLTFRCRVEGGDLPAEGLWLRLHSLPAGLRCPAAPVVAQGVAGEGIAELEVHCLRRGIYAFPSAEVFTEFPFGLLRRTAVRSTEHRLMVTPAFVPLTQMPIARRRRYQPGGLKPGFEQWDAYEYYANREYRVGDSPRNFDWRATARLAHPIVREYREEFALRALVVLDLQVGSSKRSAGSFERTVSHAAALCDYLLRERFSVDLLLAGSTLNLLTFGPDETARVRLSRALAAVRASGECALDAVERTIGEEAERFSVVSLLFQRWDERRVAVVERRVAAGDFLRAWAAENQWDRPIRDSAGLVEALPSTAPRGHREAQR